MDKFETHSPISQSAALLRIWLAAAIAVLVASVAMHMMIGLNNDHLDLFDQVRHMLAGGTPYVSFMDVNPPLIHMLYTPPIIIAGITGLPQAWVLNGLTLALIGWSLLVCKRVLKYSAVPQVTCRIVLSGIALSLVTASFIHQVFADRDHLMVVLVSPWLVLYSPLARRELIPVRCRRTVALMGAVGFAIKPYFYALYIASLGFNLFCGTSRKGLMRQWEPYVVAGFAVAYLCIIFAFFPHYPHTAVPLALYTYGALQWDWQDKWHVITSDLFGGYAVAGMAAALALLLTSRAYYDRSITYLFTLLVAATLIFVVQGGWYYTQYSFIAIALVLAIVTVSKLIEACGRIRDRRTRLATIAVLSIFLVSALATDFGVPVYSRAYWDIDMQRKHGHPLENFDMSREAAGVIQPLLEKHPRFMFFSITMRSVNLLREGTQRVNVGRFDYLWPLPGILAMGTQPDHKEAYEQTASYLSGSIAQDIEQNQPEIVINDVSTDEYPLPSRFNTVRWLKQDPRFVGAWQAYALGDNIDTCTPREERNCAYEIYFRK